MKKFTILLALLATVVWAGEQAFEYIGTSKCKMCHKGDKKGNMFEIWEASSHAKAFETLKSDHSAEIAKKLGLKVPAYQAPECLGCHTTGFGKGGYAVKDDKFWNPAEDDKDGKKAVKLMENLQHVGCESCHGPGSEYKSKKIMQAIFDGTSKGAEVGLADPNEQLCIQCHNEKSPTFDKEAGFKFAEQVKLIAHPVPAKK